MPVKTPMDHLEAEAKKDPNASLWVALADKRVEVLPVMKWKSSGLRALRENNVDLWAEKCLAPGSYAVWQKVDPDLEQCEAFFDAWTAASGESIPE